MKMCKMVPIFILLFTEYICNASNVTMETEMEMMMTSFASHPVAARGLSPPLEDHTQAFTRGSTLGPIPSNNPGPPERHLSSALVAGISIFLVLLFIIIIAGFWYAKKSRERSVPISSDSSTKPKVVLRNISDNENQP